MTKLPSLARASWLKASPLQHLLAAISEAGGEARVAGGAVRNALMKLPITEIDIATTLPPTDVTVACSAQGMSVHPTGIDHGTVTVVVDGHPFEVTTLRHDVETDGRRAKVKFTDDWQTDAMRRDFTMNALYCNSRGKIFDFTNGYRDILARRIIFVGRASERIEEDFLRILRFFRFHAQFGKGVPDRTGLLACVRHRRGIDGLSAERVRQEMYKLLKAPGAVQTLKAMARHKILMYIIPYTEDWRTISRLPPDPVLRLAVLAKEPAAMRERWRLSNQDAFRLERVLSTTPPTPALRPAEQKIILYQVGADAWRDAVSLAWARSKAPLNDAAWRKLYRLPDRWMLPELPVSGRDLLNMGMHPGPAVGETLKRLEDWWVASGFKPDKIELLKRAR